MGKTLHSHAVPCMLLLVLLAVTSTMTVALEEDVLLEDGFGAGGRSDARAEGDVGAEGGDRVGADDGGGGGGGKCVWYGECGLNPNTGKMANCPYSGAPKPLAASALATLTAVCPELVKEIQVKGNARTCCSGDQINTLLSQMALGLGMLRSCPSCVRNFRLTFCYMTCAPDQARYMSVAATAPAVNDASKTVITHLNFNISRKFSKDVYRSCKDVSMPSTNAKAMSVMCGSWGAYYCNDRRWFTYMGTTENGFAPFQITYKFQGPRASSQFRKQVVPCNKRVNKGGRACSCMDCKAACPKPPPVPPPSASAATYWSNIFLTVLCVTVILWIILLFFGIYHDNVDAPHRWLHCKCPARLGHRLCDAIQSTFVMWGTGVGRYPWLVLLVSASVAAGLSSGLLWLQVTTDPVELWAAPSSVSRQEKTYFEDHFPPFYRTEMLIIRPVGLHSFKQRTPNGLVTWGPVFHKSFLQAVAALQNHLTYQVVGDDGTTLNDICFKPLSPDNTNCTIQSVLNYFQNDPKQLDYTSTITYGDATYNITYLDHISNCFRNPVSPSDASYNGLPCLGSSGAPVFPYTAVGGFLKGSTNLGENPEYTAATAVVITFVVNNHKDHNDTLEAMAWEKRYLSYLSNFSHPLLDVAHAAERSVEDELLRQSSGDVFTVLVSYVAMFLYIILSIGHLSGCRRLLVDSKVTLGLVGVLVVLASVTAAVGVLSLLGVPATLIVVEVIPFLVLAVGVDNMFLLVRSLQRAEKLPTETHAEQMGRVLGDAAPALLISTASEASCFFLGALSPMPAVRAFALYAGLALSFAFLLQMSAFLAVLSLDHRRHQSNRLDVFCCVKASSSPPAMRQDGVLTRFVRVFYAPALMNRHVKFIVNLFVCVLTIVSAVTLTRMEVGLNQELAMPEDSYMQKYFSYLSSYLSVGPPVYFVMKPGMAFGMNISEQNKVCGTVDCDTTSLGTHLYLASLQSDVTSLARPASSWLDDYISWSMYNRGSIDLVPCCRIHRNGTFCPSTSYDDMDCNPCNIAATPDGLRPTVESFDEFLPWFLQDNPSQMCPKAGHAAYGDAVNLIPGFTANTSSVGASYFMTYHTILRTSKDYYTALERARIVATDITREINKKRSPEQFVEVFPYSIFYVFYEQYLAITSEAVLSTMVSVLTVYLVMLVFSGFDFYTSTIVAFGLTFLVINMGGCMYWFNVPLNAVSLVNIIMSVGIFVEFLSHLAFAFARVDHPDADQRMIHALAETGTAVVSGITVTKIVGVSVLAFAHSQIFRVFYFRMYLFIIVLGAVFGLAWLPVVLAALAYYIPPNRQHGNTSTFTRISEQFYSPTAVNRPPDNPCTPCTPAHNAASVTFKEPADDSTASYQYDNSAHETTEQPPPAEQEETIAASTSAAAPTEAPAETSELSAAPGAASGAAPTKATESTPALAARGSTVYDKGGVAGVNHGENDAADVTVVFNTSNNDTSKLVPLIPDV